MLTMTDACRILGSWRHVLTEATCEDIDILFNICAQDSLTVKQLVLSSLSSRTTVLRRLNNLVDRGIVSIRPDTGYKRVRKISLTAKGARWALRVAEICEGRSRMSPASATNAIDGHASSSAGI
jgi:DNA-binding MarR family transcriptional regulator